MSQALVLFRSTNFDGKNKLIYNIPGSISLKNKEVALQSFSFYNSFFNISSEIGNNKVVLSFPVFSSTVDDTYSWFNSTWTIADGFYSFTDLQYALQQHMLANKLCLYSSQTGKYMYFMTILPNTVQYAVQIQSYYLPTAAQATTLGYALLPNSPLLLNISTATPARLVAPYMNVTAAFGKVIGFVQTLVPATPVTKMASVYDANPASTNLSTRTPYLNPIDCIALRCNIANNINSIPNDLLSVTPISSQYGAITQYTAPFPLYVPCIQSNVQKIEVTMCDQNMKEITQRDAEITMVLSIRDAPSSSNN